MNLSSKPLRSKDLGPDLNTEHVLKTYQLTSSALTDTIQEGKEYANSCFPLFSKTANCPPHEPSRGTCVCARGGDSAQVFPLLSTLFLPSTLHLQTFSYCPKWQKKKNKIKNKKRMCESLAVTQGLMKTVTKFPGFGTKYVSFCIVDAWGWVVLCAGDRPVCCRASSGVPGL